MVPAPALPTGSGRLFEGAARAWVCLRLGAALASSARRRTCGAGVGKAPASGWLVCTGSRGLRAASLGLGALVEDRLGLGRLAQCVLAAEGGQRDGELG